MDNTLEELAILYTDLEDSKYNSQEDIESLKLQLRGKHKFL